MGSRTRRSRTHKGEDEGKSKAGGKGGGTRAQRVQRDQVRHEDPGITGKLDKIEFWGDRRCARCRRWFFARHAYDRLCASCALRKV